MYSLNYLKTEKNLQKSDILNIINNFYSGLKIKSIELGNENLDSIQDLPEKIPFIETNAMGIRRTYLIIRFINDNHFNIILDENSSSSMSIILDKNNVTCSKIEEFITSYKPLKFSFEHDFQAFNINVRIKSKLLGSREKIFKPYWIQLINKDLFEKINTITPVKKLFENENGVVMQLTEEPTSADNPEHLEKVIKIYEGLFPDFKADRIKLNELKAKQEANSVDDYKKTQPKSFLSKLFSN